MNRPPSPCVLCSRFHRQDDAPAGQGMCAGYEKLRRHDDSNEACPLWREATDRQERMAWATQQERAA